jgi:hypothetical protein
MNKFHSSVFLVALLLAYSPAHAIEIACGGYSPKVNDHVEWSLKITSSDAYDGKKHFKVSETKSFLVLSGPHSRIRINKAAKTYVRYGPNGKAIEWSRKVPGEGCDFSN